jgi:hypothetical protein
MARQTAADTIAFLNPDTAVAGGLRNMFEGTIVRAAYEPWDFNGKAKPSTYNGKRYSGVKMALRFDIDDIDDDNPDPEKVYWPAGHIEDFAPSDDGRSFTAITGRSGFSRDSEIIQGMKCIIDSGAIKQTDLVMDPSIFEGLRFRWERKPPLWAKKQEAPTDGTQQKDISNLMPVKFIEAAGGKNRGAGKPAAGSASGKSKPVQKDDDDDQAGADTAINDLGVKLVLEVLEDRLTDKSIPAADRKTIGREALGSDVLALMLTTYKKGPEAIDKDTRNAIGELFENDAFLESNAGKKTWKYDSEDGEVTKVG